MANAEKSPARESHDCRAGSEMKNRETDSSLKEIKPHDPPHVNRIFKHPPLTQDQTNTYNMNYTNYSPYTAMEQIRMVMTAPATP